jgi:hypothetical protein
MVCYDGLLQSSQPPLVIIIIEDLLDLYFLLVGVMGLSNPCAIVTKALITVQSENTAEL